MFDKLTKLRKKIESVKNLMVIEKFLTKYSISGVMYVPGQGSFSLYKNSNDKLVVLDHCKSELLLHDMTMKQEAREKLDNTTLEEYSKNNTKKGDVDYIG